MPATLGDVLDDVRDRIDPSPEERARLAGAVDRVVERAEAAVEELPVAAEVRHVGSTARGTWIAGERDIDVFVRFPPDLSRADLERYGLEVGHAVLPEGREEYAEHPYVTGSLEGFEVDLVPCYAVESARSIKSAVDRTPFHTDYVAERLTDELAREVRLLKVFLIGISVYGSDLRTRGVSGYLTELLVLEYGRFRAVVEAAADWTPPVRLDPAGHGVGDLEEAPLVVVDPTDPDRNVAAVLSPSNLARFQHYARDLLAAPRAALFTRTDRTPLSRAEVTDHVRDRGTTPVAVVFEAPDLHDDELYPQLRKSARGVRDELDRRGFDVIRWAVFADGRAALWIELAHAERPAIERHEGPPVATRDHAGAFLDRYAEAAVYGPFIDGDRYVVERRPEFTAATALLESPALFDVRHGPGVAEALEADYEVLAGEDVSALADEFGTELAAYYDPMP